MLLGTYNLHLHQFKLFTDSTGFYKHPVSILLSNLKSHIRECLIFKGVVLCAEKDEMFLLLVIYPIDILFSFITKSKSFLEHTLKIEVFSLVKVKKFIYP